MFTDNRSKQIIFTAHCIHNQNSISDGTADYPACIKPVVELLAASNVGVVQLPCPELNCLGLDRGNINGANSPVVVENTRIRKELLQDEARAKLNALVQNVVYQIEEYTKHGFEIKGIVGINRSPSCGVETTSDNNEEVPGSGVFMQTLHDELTAKNIDIKFVGIKVTEIKEALGKINELLKK